MTKLTCYVGSYQAGDTTRYWSYCNIGNINLRLHHSSLDEIAAEIVSNHGVWEYDRASLRSVGDSSLIPPLKPIRKLELDGLAEKCKSLLPNVRFESSSYLWTLRRNGQDSLKFKQLQEKVS